MFLTNAWYAAGWEHDLQDVPLARTYLDQPVMLCRDTSGTIYALADACPHRFAPLSKGRIQGDTIRCPYHGLIFDMAGRCVFNPHGRGARPASLSVRTFPLAIGDGMIWIWMGETGKAAYTPIPSYPFLADPNLATLHGYLHVGANYELVSDNLLDLSHAEFLHPFLAPEGSSACINYHATEEQGHITAYHDLPDVPNTPLFEILLGRSVTRINGRAHMHWDAPSNLRLDTGAIPVGSPDEDGVSLPQAHLLTPETATSTHYFWGVSRDRAQDNEQVSAMLRFGLAQAFEEQDEPMIRAVQERMRGRELFDLSPALLPMDEAAVRARRILRRRIVEEGAANEI